MVHLYKHTQYCATFHQYQVNLCNQLDTGINSEGMHIYLYLAPLDGLHLSLHTLHLIEDSLHPLP